MEHENVLKNIKDLPQSYDNCVWIQMERCFFFGSQDTTNVGVVSTQDEEGGTREIVRYNYVSAFIHAVELLYFLVKLKHDKLKDLKFKSDIKDETNDAYKKARENFKLILTFINKSGLFGYESLVEYYGGEDEGGTEEDKDRLWQVEETQSAELQQ